MEMPASDQTLKSNLIIQSDSYFNKKKKRGPKILLTITLVLVIVYFLTQILPILLFASFIPEKCMESNIFTYDRSNMDSLKYVECLKGYSTTNFIGGGYTLHTTKTSGYVIPNKEGGVKNVLQKKYSTGDFYNPVDVYFIDKGLFVLKDAKNTNGLYDFKDGNIEKIRDVSFYVNNIIAYDNNTLYYYDTNREDNTLIYKENLLTGESSKVIDLNYIERNKLYGLLYFVKTFKENNYMMMTFAIVEPNSENEDYYSLNLDTAELIKTKTEPRRYANDMSYYGVPPMATLSLSKEKSAASYGLKYGPIGIANIATSIAFFIKNL